MSIVLSNHIQVEDVQLVAGQSGSFLREFMDSELEFGKLHLTEHRCAGVIQVISQQ